MTKVSDPRNTHSVAEDDPPGLEKCMPYIIVQWISGAIPIQVKQYPISAEAREGTKNHIR